MFTSVVEDMVHISIVQIYIRNYQEVILQLALNIKFQTLQHFAVSIAVVSFDW